MSEADDSKEALFRAVEEQLKGWRDEREAQGARVEAYFQGFSDSLQSEDLTGVLIRGQLYVENEMNRVLANAMPNFEAVLKRSLEFDERLTLLRALCLISAQEWIAFKALNTARNSLAHMRSPGVVPVAMSDLVRNLYQVTRQLRDDVEMDSAKAENDADALREIIMVLMVHLYVRAEVTSDNKGMDDTFITIRPEKRYSNGGKRPFGLWSTMEPPSKLSRKPFWLFRMRTVRTSFTGPAKYSTIRSCGR